MTETTEQTNPTEPTNTTDAGATTAATNDNTESASSGTGAPAAPATVTADTGYADPASAPGAADAVAIPREHFEQVLHELGDMEQTALFWGGERGVKLRNSVCRARLLLTSQE